MIDPKEPMRLLELCREATAYVPLSRDAQRAVHDALVLCAYHFCGHPSFFADNHRMVDRITDELKEWVQERTATVALAKVVTKVEQNT